MIRDYILAWASVILLIFLAFILMPSYERFKDAQGKEVDVDPNAPPMPEWLKSKDPRKEGFVTNVPVTVTTQPSSPAQTAAQQSRLPPPPPVPQGIPPRGTPDYNQFKEFCRTCETDPIGTFFRLSGPPQSGERSPEPYKQDSEWVSWGRQMCSLCKLDEFAGPISSPPSSTESNVPSGVNTIPSQSMPNNNMLSPAGADIPTDVQTISRTLPPPRFEDPMGMDTGYGDKYVLKSSLVPCATGSCSRVPGGNDGMTPTAGGIPNDGISKPFSAAFGSKTEPEGYLNSFAAFMK